MHGLSIEAQLHVQMACQLRCLYHLLCACLMALQYPSGVSWRVASHTQPHGGSPLSVSSLSNFQSCAQAFVLSQSTMSVSAYTASGYMALSQQLANLRLPWNRFHMHAWPLAMLKIDIRKAFDTLEPQTMLLAVCAKRVSWGLALAVFDLHCGRMPAFTLGSGVSEPTFLERGVARGVPTSAWLFQISLDYLLAHTRSILISCSEHCD